MAEEISLVFLASQPRAGSTMLQRILGAHSEIHTLSEPWIMLHPVYALREHGYEAEYDASLAKTGLASFLHELPDGRADYEAGIRQMFGHLYAKALQSSKASIFLDKTPRYYHILPELHRIFPSAKFLLLYRNPLAVLASILRTWVKSDLSTLTRFRHDLLSAPQLLCEGRARLGDAAVSVRYEDLVRDPESEMRRLCGFLGIPFGHDVINYGRTDVPDWKLGDQTEVNRRGEPVEASLDTWIRQLSDPQHWRLMSDYLVLLEDDVIDQLGYSADTLRRILEQHHPGRLSLYGTLSLQRLTELSLERSSTWEREKVRLFSRLRYRGVVGVAADLRRRLRRKLT